MSQHDHCLEPAAVIGQQMAEAIRAEKERVATHREASSPLPPEAHYDPWAGDFDLTDPAENPLDNEIAALCQSFAKDDEKGRSRFREFASMDDFYTLLTFSNRSAVFGMRERTAKHLVCGFTSIAMIERARIDYRDAIASLGLLNHAGRVAAVETNSLLGEAALLAEPKMSDLMRAFQKKTEDYKDIRTLTGHTVIETDTGPGFIGWERRPYRPRCDLDRIALQLSKAISQDKYGAPDVTLASELPRVWLAHVDDRALNRALTSVRAAVTIHVKLRPQESEDNGHQSLMLFLAEFNAKPPARLLFSLFEQKQKQVNDFAMCGVQEGHLFCLLIQSSIQQGSPPFENQGSIQRFAALVSQILRSSVL